MIVSRSKRTKDCCLTAEDAGRPSLRRLSIRGGLSRWQGERPPAEDRAASLVDGRRGRYARAYRVRAGRGVLDVGVGRLSGFRPAFRSASRIFALVKPGAFAMSRITFSRRETRSIARRQFRDALSGNHHRAVEIGVNDVVVADQHAEDVHLAFHLHHVDVRVARADATADDLETRCEHVEVAERAVGDAADAAESRDERLSAPRPRTRRSRGDRRCPAASRWSAGRPSRRRSRTSPRAAGSGRAASPWSGSVRCGRARRWAGTCDRRRPSARP